MQVSVENVGTLERRVTVRLPAEELDGQVRDRLREISRTAQIKGFRKGKVPATIIEQRWGRQVRSEAMDALVRDSFSRAVDEQKLRPAGSPQIDTSGAAEAGELTYTATFEVIPEFGQIDVSGLKINRAVASVEDTDIDRMLDTLRQQRRSWNAVERPAQAGDMVSLETYSTVGDLRLPAEGVERGNTVLGSGTLLPALEELLLGMSSGEERDGEVLFPADWRVEALAGQHANVHVKAVKVSAPHLPEIDADFIRSFGVKGGNLEQFRKEVRANLERELKGALMSQLRGEVLEKLVVAHADVELPQRMIEAEARNMARNAENQARQQGQQNVTANHEAFMAAAKKRVAAGLLVGEVARQNNLKLEPQRVNETLALIASTYEQPQQVLELYRNDPNLMSQLRGRVMEEQVMDWIADRAEATEQSLTFADVMRPIA